MIQLHTFMLKCICRILCAVVGMSFFIFFIFKLCFVAWNACCVVALVWDGIFGRFGPEVGGFRFSPLSRLLYIAFCWMKQKFDDATLRMSVVDDATAQECWGGVGWCPRMVCVAHFDFEMCFAPQRRALFRHLNFQKWSENGCALYILTSKCTSRHNGVQFFISHLASCLCTRRFRSLLFDPPEPQITGKIQCFATFLPFRAPASSFFWPFLFSDLLSSALLSSTLSSLLSDSSHLCFSSVHIVGSLTSKLPSAIFMYRYRYMHIHARRWVCHRLKVISGSPKRK